MSSNINNDKCGFMGNHMVDYFYQNELQTAYPNIFQTLNNLAELYHLNDVNSGTPKQQQFLHNIKHESYDNQIKALAENNLLVDDGFFMADNGLFMRFPNKI